MYFQHTIFFKENYYYQLLLKMFVMYSKILTGDTIYNIIQSILDLPKTRQKIYVIPPRQRQSQTLAHISESRTNDGLHFSHSVLCYSIDHQIILRSIFPHIVTLARQMSSTTVNFPVSSLPSDVFQQKKKTDTNDLPLDPNWKLCRFL